MYQYARISFALALALGLAGPLPVLAQQPQVLGNFIQQTITLHPAIRAAEKAIAKARANRQAAGKYPYNPELGVDYENSAENTIDFGVSQTIDAWGRRDSKVTVATAGIEIASAEYDLIKTELIERLLLALGENRKQMERLRLAEKRLSLSDRFLKLIQRSAAAGDVGQNDVLTAEINKSNAELLVVAARAEVSEAQRELIALVGEKRSSWPIPPDVQHLATNEFRPELSKTPEQRLAQASLKVSKAGIVVADRERLPDPTIGFRVGEEGEERLYGLSLSVPIPVWNNGVAEKLAASQEAAGREFLVADTRRRIRARLITAEESFNAALSAVGQWRSRTAPAARKQEQLINRLAESREIGALEYLQQLNQLIDTEALGIDQEATLWRAWVTRLRAGANLNVWLEDLR